MNADVAVVRTPAYAIIVRNINLRLHRLSSYRNAPVGLASELAVKR